MKKILLLLAAVIIGRVSLAADKYPRQADVDILHYHFHLQLSDQNDVISGETTIEVRFTGKKVSRFSLDLVGKEPGERTGMTVQSVVSSPGKALPFTHRADRLTIDLPAAAGAGETRTFRITYRGIPEDGLIISKNQYGDRTFFGDNWPNRAHYWLPTVDHPSDKATCEFSVEAPAHYQVVANGTKIAEKTTSAGNRLTHWKESVPVPTKVMVIGVARFAVERSGEVGGRPVESWVFPQNREAGFYDYALAVPILKFMEERIGPFPYEKLANVQSKTRYGGMENASCIFYSETSVTGQRDSEDLLAHEIAHQWFGDSASELDWYHVWLSEGFATYFTQVYLEATYGRERLTQGMREARDKVLAYYRNTPNSPVVDTMITDLNQLLSPNAYQKGAWVLHMLRHTLGDEAFFRGIRTYYQQYRDRNALTEDLQRVMEQVSGKKLDGFFRQWVYQPGQPMLRGSWRYDAAAREVVLDLSQTQPGALFRTPLDVALYNAVGQQSKLATLELNQKQQTFRIALPEEPARLVLDPDTWLLMTGTVEKSNGR